jgi:hypothetical protein
MVHIRQKRAESGMLPSLARRQGDRSGGSAME